MDFGVGLISIYQALKAAIMVTEVITPILIMGPSIQLFRVSRRDVTMSDYAYYDI